ncbi:MAG: DUF1186 domain-containing protein [Spirochaetaceae bacterium]|nr:MAG: DUF1186 domain-containing protein [Spirochaetaceae bacterium]
MIRSQCRFCGNLYARSGIARHVAACKARLATNNSDGSDASTDRFEHLVVTDADRIGYRLDLLAAPGTTLDDLDRFLREIWLECCGHMSIFRVGGQMYYSSVEAWGIDDSTAEVEITWLPRSTEIRYDYDLGSPTGLRVKRLSPLRQRVTGAPIVLAARNEPPPLECSCGSHAVVVDRFADWGNPGLLCAACLEEAAVDSEALVPLTNSPRMGVCGYVGPGSDPDGEYASRPEAERMLAGQPGRRDQEAIDNGPPAKRMAIVADYLGRLDRPARLASTTAAARFINRNLTLFASPLRDFVVAALDPEWRQPAARGSARHVYALYLVGQLPDARLFSALVKALREGAPVVKRFGEAFHYLEPCSALFASLCCEDPSLLARAAADDGFILPGRGCAIRAIAALHLTDLLDREQAVKYLGGLADAVVASGKGLLGDSLADAICAIHPEDLIRVVQRLDREGLLDNSTVDYLSRVRDLLQQTVRGHRALVELEDRYTLFYDPIDALDVVLADDFHLPLPIPVEGRSHGAGFEPLREKRSLGLNVRDDGVMERSGRKVGRNERCPCGSGKKYKHCCGR